MDFFSTEMVLLMTRERRCRGQCKGSLRRLWEWWRVSVYMSLRVVLSYSLRCCL